MPARMMVIVALLVSSSILLFAYVAKTLLPMRSVAAILATCVLPPVIALIDGLVARRQERLAQVHRILARMIPRPPSVRSLVLALAFLPVALLAAVSVVSPMFVLRGTLVFAPYLILVLAVGLSDLLRRDSGWVAPALALALVLGIAHGVSIVHYKSLRPSHDYKGLAARWAPEIEGADLIFVHGRGHSMDWAVAPIFYYLNARRYRYVGRNYSKAIRDNPRSRVWVMSLVSVPTEQEATDALTDYERRTRIEAAGLAAELYVPRAPMR